MHDAFDILDVEQLLTGFISSLGLFFTQNGQEIQPSVYAGVQNLETHQNEGEESSLVKLPCIVCLCQNADALGPEFIGNWEPDVELTVYTDSSDATSAEHKENVRTLWREVLTDTLAQDLTTFSNGSFYSSRAVFTGQRWTTDGNCWASTLAFTLRQACKNEIHNED